MDNNFKDCIAQLKDSLKSVELVDYSDTVFEEPETVTGKDLGMLGDSFLKQTIYLKVDCYKYVIVFIKDNEKPLYKMVIEKTITDKHKSLIYVGFSDKKNYIGKGVVNMMLDVSKSLDEDIKQAYMDLSALMLKNF